MTVAVGLIGGGNISDTHARAVRGVHSAEIAAIWGTNLNNVQRLSREHGGVAHLDLDAFLAHRPMDMVMVGSPSGLHAAHGIAAARKGLHVLVEKPIDIRTDRADALIAEAKTAGVKLGVVFQDRLKPGIRRMKDLVDQGVLGNPILADARVKWYRLPEYYVSSRWRGTWSLDGGAALINQGVHTVDLLLWFFGNVTRVQAAMKTKLHNIEAEDTLVALLEFESGALGVLQAATSVYPGYPRRIELTGSEGTMILEQDRVIEAQFRHADSASVLTESIDANTSSSSPVVSDHRAHQAVLEDFIHSIETDSIPACDGEEGRRSLALIESIYKCCRVTST